MPKKKLYYSTQRKYGNKKIIDGNEVFDSKKEYKHWCDLKILEKAGMISNLQRQVKYTLVPVQREPDTKGPKGGIIKGKVIEREVAYFADFVYLKDGETIVEDTKGVRTKEYVIKRKLMLERHGIRIKEI